MTDSGILHQGGHHATPVLGDPGLLQEWPDLPALVLQGGGDREQLAAADRDAGGLDAMADRALNHPLAQGRLSGVGGGFDPLDDQERPQGFAALQQLAAGRAPSWPWAFALLAHSPDPPRAQGWPRTPGGWGDSDAGARARRAAHPSSGASGQPAAAADPATWKH